MPLIITLLSIGLIFGGSLSATPNGAIMTSIQEPVAITEQALKNYKSASASTISILSMIAFGDASVEKLAKKAGIKEAYYIDKKTFNLLNIFYKETFTIYGI